MLQHASIAAQPLAWACLQEAVTAWWCTRTLLKFNDFMHQGHHIATWQLSTKHDQAYIP